MEKNKIQEQSDRIYRIDSIFPALLMRAGESLQGSVFMGPSIIGILESHLAAAGVYRNANSVVV
jgi:hypothetical protein